ncbi:Cyclin-dependent kinase 6 [Hypsizygus marmoreus]|uniref:Cyclin-dependent kinase 6 n=1 Tax=Hypsizygus marmoreus TaxID=39966 RepID=A0A369JM21_HYPMA|nr:Cyclin-dependent kinase 6 [Hypsizygus marmoreus]
MPEIIGGATMVRDLLYELRIYTHFAKLRDLETKIQTLECDSRLDDHEQSLQKRMSFWGSTTLRFWFINHGYTLYQTLCKDNDLVGSAHPTMTVSDPENIPFPYAYQGGDDDHKLYDIPALCTQLDTRGMVFYAQDAQGRHVALKAIRTLSEECRILQFLSRQPIPSSVHEFQHVLPVLDVLPFGRSGYSFAVMPRWGDCPTHPFPRTMKDVLLFMHCLLKALNYLHEHRIAHGDINPGNVLVNHFGRRFYDTSNPLRSDLQSRGLLTYALFDFGSSSIFPQTSKLQECRLPYHKSWSCTPGYFPSDTMQGEFDYNPFVHDVGMLGIMFCNEFQHLTIYVPILAPFLDRMVTRTLSRRFTASEALHHFEAWIYPQMTEEQLKIRTTPCPEDARDLYEVYDRWAGLDPEFIQKWAGLREPPIPFSVRLMRHLCDYEHLNAAIAEIRRIIYRGHQWIWRFLPSRF